MGTCDCNEKPLSKSHGTDRINHLSNDHPPIPLYITDEIKKAVCKIIILTNKGNNFGTGFFMNAFENKYLITNYHNISKEIINENIEIETYNHKRMKLNFYNRQIKYYPKYRDITIIEMKNTDKIYKYIKFLDFDKSYLNRGYQTYLNKHVFLVGYPHGEYASSVSGRIKRVNCYEFEHNIDTYSGCSGSPIMLLNTDIDYIYVIGIHKQADYSKNINYGTFIGEIFNEIDKYSNFSSNYSIENYIIAEIYIRESDINTNLRIINSYEEFCRQNGLNSQDKNEKDIKNSEIRINNVLIPFNYFFKFPSRGIYSIKYSFKTFFTNTCFMFSLCSSLIKIDMSNFYTQNVTDMSGMFFRCRALTNLEISNLNTENVMNMSYMFSECYSLKNINLSNFNTKNVINMCHMFSWCLSLSYINLSNFDTSRVNNFTFMFLGCKSLRRENLITRDNRMLKSLLKTK